jgi:hypothetical protein
MAYFDLGRVSCACRLARKVPYQLVHGDSNHVLSDDNGPTSCQKQNHVIYGEVKNLNAGTIPRNRVDRSYIKYIS